MRCWGFATALLSDIRQLVARPCPLSSRKRIVCVVAAAAWLHFHCKRGLLVFHKYPLRHLGFSAERQLKTRTNTDGREARDRCFQQSSRLCPEAQILSLTRLCFRIAPPQYSSHAFFPFVPKAGFELVFCSLLGTGRIPELHSQKAEQNGAVSRRSWGSASGDPSRSRGDGGVPGGTPLPSGNLGLCPPVLPAPCFGSSSASSVR